MPMPAVKPALPLFDGVLHTAQAAGIDAARLEIRPAKNDTQAWTVIIAGAGGAAHLPGMIAAKTLVPVLGVPVQSAALSGVDSLYSIVQMPRGIPVGTPAIGKAGAANAALLAAQILATHDKDLHQRLNDWRKAQTDEVLENPDPRGAA
jgi:5-(carboxyamino)imidazole ribonucleotide mutase